MTRFAALVALVAAPPAGPAADVSFNRDVRPILSENCFACHGFDAKARKAKLRLDTPEGAYAERNGVAPLKPGDLANSEVWTRVLSNDPDETMPPPSFKKKLTAAQKATLKSWIEQGAKYQKHWAFEAVTRPPVPAGKAANPIDRFLNARLKAEGLKPTPEADRETLIRRAAFALTGLPPTVAEVDEFLKDTKPKAYERMVDRYLASPRYGEEMARHWLDVARYADTHGLHLDNERSVWGYRDWVVKAFNRNLPFDQFTVDQVAGDLLPDPTPDRTAATGFLRCNVTTSEGGSIAKEWEYRNAVDRTATLTQAWLGLTGGCCQCHDHKYDPVSQKEFYSLYAFFYSAADPGLDGNVKDTAPVVRLSRAEQTAARETAAKIEADARGWLDAAAGRADYADPAKADPKPARRPVRDVLIGDAFPVGATAVSSTRNQVEWRTDPPFGAAEGRRVIRQAGSGSIADTITFQLRPVVVPHDGAFEVWVWADPLDPPASIAFGVSPGAAVAKKKAAKPKGNTVTWKRGDPKVVPGQWVKLTVPAADLGLDPGQQVGGVTLTQAGGVAYWDGLTLSGFADPATDPLESFAAWRKAVGAKSPPDFPAGLTDTLKADDKKPVDPKLTAFYLAVVARPATAELMSARLAWEAARAARVAATDDPPPTLVYRDLPTPRPSFVMMRGQYDAPGEEVTPGVPAVLPQLKLPDPKARATRLDLARWLVAAENPLTARVAANRVWQQFFGVGLVKSSNDFGTQGEPPSHPELLDWLAAEYQSGWDTKKFVKLIVTSDAFRRSAKRSEADQKRDPENRLVARGPRFRLDAEQVRDNALFTGGLIDLSMGGPGAKPYQPANLWEPIGFENSNTRFYLQDHGPALYRRSLYTFLKRTVPPPFMANFDAPNREASCSARDRTNTPLQALQLLNDTQHVEAARALAERAVAEGGKDTPGRIEYLYRTVLSRRPTAAEAERVAAVVEKELALYRDDPAAAEAAVKVGESAPKGAAPAPEVAAWAIVANLVLNLDETLNH